MRTILLLLLVATSASWAQTEPLKLTLTESLRTAVDHSARLAEYQARNREARAKVDESYVPAYPTAVLSAGYNQTTPGVATQGIVITPPGAYTGALTINQALYTFGRLRWGTETAEMAERSAHESYRVQVEQLFLEVAQNYYAAILAEEALVIASDRVKSQEQQLTDSTNLARAGVVARFDVVRSEAELSRVRQVEIQARTEVKLARDRLLTRLGLPVGQDLALDRGALPTPPPTDLAKASQRALELRPEMGVLRYAVDSAKAKVRYEDSQDAPTLALQSTTYARTQTGFNPGQQNVTGLVLSIPLFDGGLAGARTDQAIAVVEQLIQQQENTRRDVLLEVREAYNTLVNNWDKIAVAEKTVTQSAEGLRVAYLRYRSGVSTNVELLSAQTDYSQARFSLATAQYEYQAAWARWNRVTSADYPVAVPGPIDRQPAPPPAPLYPEVPVK